MNDELHAAGFVEESFGDHAFLRRNCAQHAFTRAHILDGLLGAARSIEHSLPIQSTASSRGERSPSRNAQQLRRVP
jgi:hypothetical protein